MSSINGQVYQLSMYSLDPNISLICCSNTLLRECYLHLDLEVCLDEVINSM